LERAPVPMLADAATPPIQEARSFAEPTLVHGNDRLRLHHQFASTFLPTCRNVIVSLPPGYHSSSASYPVLYLQDGQNLFDPDTSFVKGTSWDVQTTSDRLIREGAIQPLIVVGVYNTGVDRLEEYTPMRDPKLGGGTASEYARLIIEELKPWIDRHYRTLDGPSHTGIGGSSLGGLVSLYLGLSHPEVFGRLAVLSPSVWWAKGGMLQFVRRSRPDPRPRIWVDMGLAEGPRMVAKCDELARLLERRGWRYGVDLTYMRVPDARHEEAAWARRVDPFLRFLFPAQ
jgi:predicted alpha/beta superfamily hydrolase